MKAKILSIFLLLLIFSCKNNKKETQETIKEEAQTETPATELKKVNVTLTPKSGSNASGNAVFVQEGNSVSLTILVSGLNEGEHAIHLHEKADCSAEDGTSTGGHWNPTAEPHGKWGDVNGYHKGDIGNLKADANGNATLNFKTDEWCIGCGNPKRDILGKAIIIHEGTDDFVTQPTGAAGGRISCGGIIE